MARAKTTRFWVWVEYLKYGKWGGVEVEHTESDSDWHRGKPFKKTPATIKLETQNAKKLSDVLPVNRCIPVVSPRVVEVLERHGADAQFYPTTLRSHSRNMRSQFYRAVNITRIISCLARKKSKFRTFSGSDDIGWLYQFELVDKAIPKRKDNSDPPWFRLGEVPRVILVSDALKRDLEAVGVAGVRFFAPPDHTDAMFSDELPYTTVPQPTWGKAAPKPVIEMVTLLGYKGSGSGALRAAMAGTRFKPKKGRATELEVPRDSDDIHLAYHQLHAVDLTACTQMPNLTSVCIDANLIVAVDLAPLAECKKLETFDASSNQLKLIDLTPLGRVKTLREVRLDRNPSLHTIDATPLRGCTKLKSIVVDKDVVVTGIDKKKIVRG